MDLKKIRQELMDQQKKSKARLLAKGFKQKKGVGEMEKKHTRETCIYISLIRVVSMIHINSKGTWVCS